LQVADDEFGVLLLPDGFGDPVCWGYGEGGAKDETEVRFFGVIAGELERFCGCAGISTVLLLAVLRDRALKPAETAA
jgi:hypothetical protein